VPRDVIEWRFLVDEADLEIDYRRGGLDLTTTVAKRAGEPLGAEVSSAVFDRVRTCDNHCEFCFIYQLPKGMRRSLYLKDDDYRLSFLYGNFTTLTRFTEADLERVVTEGLSPLNVSIHATDPDLRSSMLKNPRGGMSLRWLRALLDHGITVRGQIVLCPGVNDGAVLDRTLAGVLDRFPELESSPWCRSASAGSTPSRRCACTRPTRRMRSSMPCTTGRTCSCGCSAGGWSFAADEYYLMTGRPFPDAEAYEGFAMHEDGIGMARTFELEFTGRAAVATGVQSGFFAAVDAPPPNPAAYTGLRAASTGSSRSGCRPARTRRSASSRASSGRR
jgi:NifB/MoaA-like Fe-S oxidoreductase